MSEEIKKATKTATKTAVKTETKVDSKSAGAAKPKAPTGQYHYGVGRRKACTARAKIYPGNDFVLIVDGKDAKEYFPEFYFLVLDNMLTNVGYRQGAIHLFARGGGVMAQAEASRLAIAKALLKMDEGFRPVLRLYGYITTDVRKVLAKKAGKRKARKSEQWSKR
jgi:small subunit ribosomal protein S9